MSIEDNRAFSVSNGTICYYDITLDSTPPPPALLPCPFCSSTDVAWDTGAIECQACGARGPQHETRRVGTMQWNERTAAGLEHLNTSGD